MSKKMRIFLFICFGVFVFIITPLLGIATYTYLVSRELPSVEEISKFKYSEPMKIYDADGVIIAELGQERRYPVALSKMPVYMGQAVVAVEDSRFYQHGGVDFFSIFRAFTKNVMAGKTVEGGSTLTQQLVKILYLSPEKKLKRKIKEAILAYRLDKYLSKDEILELYLNQVNFGRGGYGVQAAAINYFGKNIKDLTLAEAALIAGTPQAPSSIAPHINMEKSKARRDHVLFRMFEVGYITEADYKTATEEPIIITDTIPLRLKYAGHFIDYINKFLSEELEINNPADMGLKVYTTLKLDHQIAGEKALRDNLLAVSKREGYMGPIANKAELEKDQIVEGKDDETIVVDKKNLSLEKIPTYLMPLDFQKAVVTAVTKGEVKIELIDAIGVIKIKDTAWAKPVDSKLPMLKDFTDILKIDDIIYVKKSNKEAGVYMLEQDPEVEGALISINPNTGEVYAMVGGFHYEKSFFNRTVQAKRQTGSMFKPIVYAAALESGMVPMDKILDVPVISEEDAEGNVWKPKNFEDKFYGPTTIKEALIKSRNVVTIKIAERIGIKKIIRYAKEFGLSSDMPTDFSVALGSASASPMEMALAYSVFATGGYRPTAPFFITRIADVDGKSLYEFKQPEMKQVLDPAVAMMMDDMLVAVVEKGSGWRVKVIPRTVGGKTGTTNGPKDAWFAGFLPNLVTVSWVGYDDFRKMGAYATGSSGAVPLWVDYLHRVIQTIPYATFPISENVGFFKVDLETREITDSINSDYTFEPYPIDSSGKPTIIRTNK